MPSAIRSRQDVEIKTKNKFRPGLILFKLGILNKQSILPSGGTGGIITITGTFASKLLFLIC
jgi:hypothetical protein